MMAEEQVPQVSDLNIILPTMTIKWSVPPFESIRDKIYTSLIKSTLSQWSEKTRNRKKFTGLLTWPPPLIFSRFLISPPSFQYTFCWKNCQNKNFLVHSQNPGLNWCQMRIILLKISSNVPAHRPVNISHPHKGLNECITFIQRDAIALHLFIYVWHFFRIVISRTRRLYKPWCLGTGPDKVKRAGILLNFPEAFIKIMIFRVRGYLGVEWIFKSVKFPHNI